MATISIVDDDPSVRKALSRLVDSCGYHAEAYESADAFLEADVLDETECLVLDVHLPGMSGLALQEELVRIGAACPIVFITAFDEERPRSKAMAAGAIEFLHKPLEIDRLIGAISKAIEGL
mgnify:CR=1 FL=1